MDLGKIHEKYGRLIKVSNKGSLEFSASALALPEKSNDPRWCIYVCVCVCSTSLFPRRCRDTLSTKLGWWFKSKHGYVAQSPGAISQVSKPSFKYFHEDEWVWGKGRRFQLREKRANEN